MLPEAILCFQMVKQLTTEKYIKNKNIIYTPTEYFSFSLLPVGMVKMAHPLKISNLNLQNFLYHLYRVHNDEDNTIPMIDNHDNNNVNSIGLRVYNIPFVLLTHV